MVMVLCAICFFCFKCLDVVRGWRHPEEPLSSARQLVGDKNLPSGMVADFLFIGESAVVINDYTLFFSD